MATETIEELALVISKNTTIVEQYLSSNNLPHPSFGVGAPSGSLIPADAADIEVARLAVIEATSKLRNLMLGPREFLQSFAHNELLSMQAISHFKIASSFPVEEEASFTQISKACGVDEPNLRRLLRHAMTKHIFSEPRKNYVAHTAASRLLAEDQQMSDWVGASTGELWQAASQTVNAMVKFSGSQEPNQTGFATANCTEKSMFEVLSQYPERAKRFGSAMSTYSKGAGYEPRHLADNYPWASLKDGIVVDVGGSLGDICIHLASKFPTLQFIVQDLAAVVAGASERLPPELSTRITFMAHDFMTEQPVKGADAYLFRWVFHNWSDRYCLGILRNLIPALKDGAHIIIQDNCLPEPNTISYTEEAKIRAMDLTMLELQNAREREMDDWADLFKQADARFKFLGGKQPTGSNLWIMEAVWEGDKPAV